MVVERRGLDRWTQPTICGQEDWVKSESALRSAHSESAVFLVRWGPPQPPVGQRSNGVREHKCECVGVRGDAEVSCGLIGRRASERVDEAYSTQLPAAVRSVTAKRGGTQASRRPFAWEFGRCEDASGAGSRKEARTQAGRRKPESGETSPGARKRERGRASVSVRVRECSCAVQLRLRTAPRSPPPVENARCDVRTLGANLCLTLRSLGPSVCLLLSKVLAGRRSMV